MTICQSTISLSKTSIQYLHANTFHSSNKPILIFLHGFPENSWSYEAYILSMSDSFRAIAPDLPGYNGSLGFEKDSDYHLQNLISCLAEFVKQIANGEPVYLVAHDWGGAIAWPFTAFYENLVKKLVILNAAHPSTFTREMLNNPRQQKQSDYITDLISENGYEIVTENNFYRLKKLYGGWFDKLSNNQQGRFIQQWSDRSSLQNAFAYYKCMPNLVTSRTQLTGEASLPNIRIQVPTLVLWGMRDTAFVPEVLHGLDDWVSNLEVVKFESEDHWLHHQKASDIITRIRNFCKN